MRAAGLVAPAIGLGLALGVLSTMGLDLGPYGIVMMFAACLFLGLCTRELPSLPLSLVVAPVLVLLMTATLFAVKLIRMPQAPLTGDGVEMVLLICGGTGVLGAIVAKLVLPRVRVLA